MHNKKAFSIIELLIVLIILSIIVSFSLYRFYGAMQESLLEKSALVLKSDIQLCQTLAEGQKKWTEMNFYSTNYTYNCEGGNIFTRKLNGVKISKTTFKSNKGIDKVTFSPEGTPIPGGTVTLQTSNGKEIYVIVPVSYGEPRIKKQN